MSAAIKPTGALARSAKTAAAWVVVLAGVLYLMSDAANATAPVSEERYLAIIAKQEDYIKSLEKIVSLCFEDKEQAVWFGDELHLCRAVPIGVFKQ